MSLKIDEMCPASVAVEDAVTGEIIAFIFGPIRRCGRTHQTFRHLLHLLEEAKI